MENESQLQLAVATRPPSVFDETPPQSKELSQRAKAISIEQRKKIITSIGNAELHIYLGELFRAMQSDYEVKTTPGEEHLDFMVVKRDKVTTDVVGVIVKRGNILSKTLEDINLVVDQVNTAFAARLEKGVIELSKSLSSFLHRPQELGSVSEGVPINKVFMVITGDISNRGRSVLARKSKGPVYIFDLNWLVQNFTEFYPQVFYDGKVADFIQNKIQELETKSWHNKANMNLSDCFVDPIVRSMDASPAMEDAKIAFAFVTKRLPFSKLRSVVSANQRIVLVGDPGTGKSAALAKLSIEILRDSYSTLTKAAKTGQKTQVPILITAKDLLLADAASTLVQDHIRDTQVIKRVGVRVLMVDALDEVPYQDREQVISKAKTFAEHLQCALILTSRKVDILSSTPSGYRKYELLPFEAGQAIKLFEKLHGKDQLLQSLKGELNKIRFQIPMVPLSLILLIELVEQNREIPASITELYERYTDTVLGRYDKKKGIEVLFEYTIKKRFLARLAYQEFLNKGRLEVPIAEYLTFLDEYAKAYTLDKDYISQFVREIERAGVIAVNETEVVFGHRSFLDYFAALYMFDKRDELENVEELIVNRYFNDFWCDTIFFYVGQKKEIGDKLLARLFDFADSGNNQLKSNLDKFLLGRLLQAGWHSPTKTKLFGIERAFDLLPALRNNLNQFTDERKWRMPPISTEFFVLILTDHSFRSGFLAKEIKAVFEKELEQKSNPLSLVPMLWAMKPFISPEEVKTAAQNIVSAVTEASQLDSEQRARALVMLGVLERGNKEMSKTIQKKIEMLENKHPGIFRKLLPQRTKGSMPYTNKSGLRTAKKSRGRPF